MPKANPKRHSSASRYYRRARTTQRTSSAHKDNIPYIFAGIFVAIIAGVFVLIWVLQLDFSGSIIVQEGDYVTIDYVGTYPANGTIFDQGTLNNQQVGNNNLLDYFDQQLVGAIAGQKKTFVVPKQFAYTDPSHKLYGQDLHFEITITKVVRDSTTLYPE